MALLLLSVLCATTVSASPSTALREYKSGNYARSLQDYEAALARKGDDPRLHFNAGAAAYRNHQFDRALKHFGQVLTAPDLKLQQQAYYNLGNTFYQLGDQAEDPTLKSKAWEQSLQEFQSSLKLNTQDADAKFNYEFVRKKLEELKKQQQQQQNNQQQNQDQQQKQQPQQNQNQNQNQDKNQQQQNQQQEQAKQDQPQAQSQDKSSEQQPPQKQPPQEAPKPEPQQAQSSPGQEKKQPAAQPQPEQQPANAAGEMTPEEARRLLDAQRNDELLLPASHKENPVDREGPVRDW